MGSLAQISSGAIWCSFSRFRTRFRRVPVQIRGSGGFRAVPEGSGAEGSGQIPCEVPEGAGAETLQGSGGVLAQIPGEVPEVF